MRDLLVLAPPIRSSGSAPVTTGVAAIGGWADMTECTEWTVESISWRLTPSRPPTYLILCANEVHSAPDKISSQWPKENNTTEQRKPNATRTLLYLCCAYPYTVETTEHEQTKQLIGLYDYSRPIQRYLPFYDLHRIHTHGHRISTVGLIDSHLFAPHNIFIKLESSSILIMTFPDVVRFEWKIVSLYSIENFLLENMIFIGISYKYSLYRVI